MKVKYLYQNELGLFYFSLSTSGRKESVLKSFLLATASHECERMIKSRLSCTLP